MTLLFSAEQSRSMDKLAIEKFGYSGFELMSMAGERAYRIISNSFPGKKFWTVLCGSGNNGGDGYVLARCALNDGVDVRVISANPSQTDDAKAASNLYENNLSLIHI